jgi:hypothetical protein
MGACCSNTPNKEEFTLQKPEPLEQANSMTLYNSETPISMEV